jgi:hypothetical protein
MLDCMTAASNPAVPAPPNLIKALRAGFDSIANHVIVLAIPLALDLLLWLGPHVQVKTLLLDILSNLTNSSAWKSSEAGTLLGGNLEALQEAIGRINLMTSLRAYPVGVPSLMAGRLPIDAPGQLPFFWDTSNLWVIIALGFGLFVIGLGIGSLYFALVAQAAVGGGIKWRQVLNDWPRAMLQVLSLTLALLIVFLVISVPTSCIISMISWGGISLGQLAIFIFLGALLWLGFPLVFTPHGIFANHSNVLIALRNSVRVTRLTMPSTSLFFLAILFISQGLDILWRVPGEDTWLTLVGIAGHAFITTGLLAATFIYFRDAERWVQMMLAKMVKQPANNNPLV